MKPRYLIIVVGISIIFSVFVFSQLKHTQQVVQQEDKKDSIVLDTPIAQSVVVSPLHLSGKARGMWYFEASFPITILDSNGKEIGSGHATAQSDWMTTDFVPFTADVEFSNPASKLGTLVLKKDNPSGDPSRDDSLVVPVFFTGK